ncbi:ATP-binding protein [Nodosilinea sp. LEGE 07298]|uniref:AlbA family DNA-binding domain-containing protein n=1 Tax=Nodosilinea sp. LEGE 07298 TaxID=2777970 RepID=UPI00188046B3|nr:ATP-binding protein [Nodosilinea sp. LEGE 07298]MBE9111127.1 ATP-binding protein [Nodosilinea sp. LEGE 07298]
MTNIISEVKELIGKEEGVRLEYKAVLPPSKNIAQLISAFANTEGGFIILGIFKDPQGKLEINGLSEDFRATTIIHKALDLLNPKPQVEYQYTSHESKKIYVIKVERSSIPILLEGRKFIRIGGEVRPSELVENAPSKKGYHRIQDVVSELEIQKSDATYSKVELANHYQSILKIINGLETLFDFEHTCDPISSKEGKILARVLFSSFVDSFEVYLSDLLYEIFLAKPETLKSKSQTVTLKEVLSCSDMQEFIEYLAKKKLGKLQRGSVKAFLDENDQISNLKAISSDELLQIEEMFQARHLFTHKNGVIDEKFIQNTSKNLVLGEEYQISVDEICDQILYLTAVMNKLDKAAIVKYKLDAT